MFPALRSPLLPFTPPRLVFLPTQSAHQDSPGTGAPVPLFPAPHQHVLPPARLRQSVPQSCSLCTFASPAPTWPFFATAPWEGCRFETWTRHILAVPVPGWFAGLLTLLKPRFLAAEAAPNDTT